MQIASTLASSCHFEVTLLTSSVPFSRHRSLTNSLSHSHLIIPSSQAFSLSGSIPLLHFQLFSLGELIASSFVLGEQQGTMAEWVLSLWQQAWDKRERPGDKEERRGEKERAQRGCWLLAGRWGSECRLITLVSMHNAIKPRCIPPSLRITSSSYT